MAWNRIRMNKEKKRQIFKHVENLNFHKNNVMYRKKLERQTSNVYNYGFLEVLYISRLPNFL